eukprot:m51a1_g11160 hypothetical protein (120) ;mRNA; f:285493-285852
MDPEAYVCWHCLSLVSREWAREQAALVAAHARQGRLLCAQAAALQAQQRQQAADGLRNAAVEELVLAGLGAQRLARGQEGRADLFGHVVEGVVRCVHEAQGARGLCPLARDARDGQCRC